MIGLLLSCFVISGLTFPGSVYGYKFVYGEDTWRKDRNGEDGEYHYGDDHWNERFPLCHKRQSPIDIDFYDVSHVFLPPLKMTGFNWKFPATLTNNGYTAKLTIDTNIKPILSGGPLHTNYEFSQLHFHWGDNDNIGSERAINGRKYPIELHVVTFNKDYGDITSAMNYSDGICALSCLFELQYGDNENYNGLVTTLSHITDPNTSAVISGHPTLLELLPQDLSKYYTYNGSLTTPPYPEVVTWVDFVDTLQSFRHLIDDHGRPMVNNFRDIQPHNNRGVLFIDGDTALIYG